MRCVTIALNKAGIKNPAQRTQCRKAFFNAKRANNNDLGKAWQAFETFVKKLAPEPGSDKSGEQQPNTTLLSCASYPKRVKVDLTESPGHSPPGLDKLDLQIQSIDVDGTMAASEDVHAGSTPTSAQLEEEYKDLVGNMDMDVQSDDIPAHDM